MKIAVSDFSAYDESELSPERYVGIHKCNDCGTPIRIWMRGWIIASQEQCLCADGISRCVMLPQSALKE